MLPRNHFSKPDSAKRGMFKIKNGFFSEHSVKVRYEPFGTLTLSEKHYRDHGYQPEFEHLPWQNETSNTTKESS